MNHSTYFIGVIISLLIIGVLNLRYNFVTKRDLDKEIGFYSIALIFVVGLWPIAMTIVAVVFILWGFYKLFVRK